jgi:DNA polymerase elongation subunit (family B)
MAERRHGEQLLFGADDAPGLVGAAPYAGGMRLWWRDPADHRAALRVEEAPFRPFFLVSHRELLDQCKPEPQVVAQAGDNYYRYRVECDDWAHYSAALKHARAAYRATKGDYEFEPVFDAIDELNLYLLSSGRTHFKGMSTEGLRIGYLALRAVASGGADYADFNVATDEVVLAALSDGRGTGGHHRVFELGAGGEAGLLRELFDAIREYDPDVLIGHDIFKSDLNYLLVRAKRHKLKLELGRDGSLATVRKSRAPAAEKQLEYPRMDIAGRSVVDTWFLTMYYDIVKRDLERFDAPYVAGYLEADGGYADPVPVWEYEALWQGGAAGRAELRADLDNELAAVQAITRNLLPSYFAQSQMLPLSLQDSVVRGNGVKINNLLLREYLRRGESIPEPKESIGGYVGGFTELRRTGLIPAVLNVDIASLYPSIMLTHHVRPECDTGDVFNPMLREMTTKRLEAKKLARTAPTKLERVAADARQAAFKVFINSFYGFLNTNRLNFTDPMQAEFITTTGQRLVKALAAEIEAAGGSVIEIDTDGVYFTAPGMEAEAAREALLERLNASLPEGINAELGGFYPAMLSLKVKNYALLGEDGEVTLKGSGLKSRGLEPFLHSFIGDSVRAILQGRPEWIEARYGELKEQIGARKLAVGELAKTDTLIESLEVYKGKVSGGGSGAGGRNRAAAYEIALRAKRPLRPGDQVSYYITGDKATVRAFEAAKPLREADPASPDYNAKYYVKKLDENLKKVRGFLSEAGPAAAEAE